MKSPTDTKVLIHHISRLEGQLRSVKEELGRDVPDCVRASDTLRAASRSFSSLRQSFVRCFLESAYITDRTLLKKQEYQSLLKIING